MNQNQVELYQRIQKFSLDDPDGEFSFSKRLTQFNHWNAKYTQRVTDEYKISFERDVHFVSMNAQHNWFLSNYPMKLLPQLYLNQKALLALLFLFGLSVISFHLKLWVNVSKPQNFTIIQLLTFYILLAIAAIMIALILRNSLREPPENPKEEFPSLNLYETAYLAGGRQRTVDTAIAYLVQHGYLQPHPETRSLDLKNPLPENSHPLEKEISLAVRFNGNINQIRLSVTRATFPIYNRLVNFGLLVSLDKAKSIQLWSALPVFVLLFLNIGMIITAIFQHKPLNLLILFCILSAIIGCSFLFLPVSRSNYGDRTLEKLRANHLNLKQKATDSNQLIQAFSLFGTKALADSPLNKLQQVLVSSPIYNSGLCLQRWVSYIGCSIVISQ